MAHLSLIGTVACCDCGRHYGTKGPLKIYNEYSIYSTVTLCDECANRRIEQNQREQEKSDD